MKKGITFLNSPGTIDSDYRGDVGVILYNTSDERFIVHKGDRIAQAMIVPYPKVEFVEVDELSETERGTGGIGSTGN